MLMDAGISEPMLEFIVSWDREQLMIGSVDNSEV